MDWLSSFHFLRPLWLLMLLPCLSCCYWLWQRRGMQTGFEKAIDADLLAYLSIGKRPIGKHQKTTLLPYIGLALLWCLGTLALAGPTWKQQPLPLYKSESAVVILLDLSPSMLAMDITPSRIVRARLKIRDLLEQRKNGLTALIVYAGEAHTVTPLSEDIDTIINLLPTLEPGLLPIPGSNIEMAVTMANQLIEDVGMPSAHLVVVTDGIDSAAESAIEDNASHIDSISILGIGTLDGAPIPYKNSFLKNDRGEIIMALVNDGQLQKIARDNSGTYHLITNTDEDIRQISRFLTKKDQHSQQEQNARYHHFDRWQEFGPYILLWLLPIASLCFRRGWVLPAVLAIAVLPSEPAYGLDWGLDWQDLWLRNDQQGQRAFQQDDYDRAAAVFNHPQWRASAEYKQGNFAAAENDFANGDTAVDHYNLANALAKQGKLTEAIDAYNQALAKAPDFEDAKFNRQLVEQLLQRQAENKQTEKEQVEKEQSQQNTADPNNNEQKGRQNNNQASNGQQQHTKKNTENSTNKSAENSDENSTEEKTEKNSKKNTDGTQQASSGQQNQIDKEANDNPLANNQSASETEQNNDDEENTDDKVEIAQKEVPVTFDERQQSYEQLLRRIPDDPSGLLRRKFNYEYQLRRQQYRRGEWQLPKNDAHKRY